MYLKIITSNIRQFVKTTCLNFALIFPIFPALFVNLSTCAQI